MGLEWLISVTLDTPNPMGWRFESVIIRLVITGSPLGIANQSQTLSIMNLHAHEYAK